MCKEDAALALIGLGVVLAIRGDRREGGITAAVSVIWFALCEKVIIPHANGGLGAFYQDFYGGLGNSVGEIAFNAVRHPSRILRVMTNGESRTYYKQLLGPFGYVPLAAPLVLLVALPHLTVNTISTFSNTHNIRFQYSALVTAALAIGAVEACAALSTRQGFRRFLVGLVAASALASNATQSPSPLSHEYRTGIWAAWRPRQASAERAVQRVPRGAGVAASYSLVPHLTHRVHIYEWPNPWIVANWGIHGERLPKPPECRLHRPRSDPQPGQPLALRLDGRPRQAVQGHLRGAGLRGGSPRREGPVEGLGTHAVRGGTGSSSTEMSASRCGL